LAGQQKVAFTGVVVDAQTQQALVNATIFMQPGALGIISNLEGVFTVQLVPGSYTFEISYLGYEPLKQEVKITKSDHKTFKLSEKSVSVESVTVTGQKQDVNIQSNNSGVIRLSGKEISRLPNLMGEADIINAMRLTPGVQGVGEGNPGLYVRGGDAGQNLFLIDNMPLYNPSHLLGFFPVFSSEIVAGATIIKGAIPAQYGGKASSVIDIDLKEGNSQNFSASGSVGLLSADITLETPLFDQNASLLISGRGTYLGLFKAAVEPLFQSSDNIFFNTDYGFYDGSLKFNYRYSERTRLSFTAFANSDDYFFADSEFKVSNQMQWGNQAAQLNVNHLFGENLRAKLAVGTTRYNFNIDAGFDKYSVSLASAIEDWTQSLDFIFTPSGKSTWRFGQQYTRHLLIPSKINVDVENVYYENDNQYFSNEWASYIQGNFKLSEKFSLAGGIRQTLFQHLGPFTRYTRDVFGKLSDSTLYRAGEIIKSYYGLDPNISAVFVINSRSSIKSSVSRVHQYIHLASVGTVSLPTDVWLPSTYFIPPQVVTQFTTGYFRNFDDNVYETSAEGYFKYLGNQIDFLNGVLDNSDNTRIEDNIVLGNGLAFGIELFVKKKMGRTTGWVSYTLSRTLRKFDVFKEGAYFPAKYDRVHDFSFTLNHKLSERWDISASFIYATGNAMTLPAGRYLIQGNIANHYTDVNSFRMPAYHRLDISANYQLKKLGRFESWLNFSVYNVYNRANPYYIYFRVKGDVDAYYLSVHPREISLFPILPSITWNFKF
jgi:hypothetical protein